MPEPGDRAAVILLIGLALVLVAPLLAILAFTAYQGEGIGFNRLTFVFICATMALVGAFWIWVSGGKSETRYKADWNLSIWKSLWSFSNPVSPPIWVGPLLLLIAVLIAFVFVDYIEPFFNR